MRIYLDNAATTMVCREAAKVALHVMTADFGNPSSTHKMGRDAKRILEESRAKIASSLGAEPHEIFFTSGGTESNNWALLSGAGFYAKRYSGKHIISSQAEHVTVLKALEILERRGFEVTRLRPEKDGSILADAVIDALREDTILVSLLAVNNETGGVTDIKAVSRGIKQKGSAAILHTDAVQAFQKIPFSAKTVGFDLISISGHKIHAPKGVGVLYIRGGGNAVKLPPLIVGGYQESKMRAGTEALPQIAAFATAAELADKLFDTSRDKMAALKEHIIKRLSAENDGLLSVLCGEAPHIISIALPGYKSEVMMNFLEARGIYVSKGSACKKGSRSSVLEACGHSGAVIDGALRIGISRYTTQEEADAFCDGIREARQSLYPSLR